MAVVGRSISRRSWWFYLTAGMTKDQAVQFSNDICGQDTQR
jgi:hypothetical protein